LHRWIGYGSRLDLFYAPLAESASQTLRLRVVNIKHGGLWLKHVREVTVLRVGATPNSALPLGEKPVRGARMRR
jgi:hypothetical protein